MLLHGVCTRTRRLTSQLTPSGVLTVTENHGLFCVALAKIRTFHLAGLVQWVSSAGCPQEAETKGGEAGCSRWPGRNSCSPEVVFASVKLGSVHPSGARVNPSVVQRMMCSRRPSVFLSRPGAVSRRLVLRVHLLRNVGWSEERSAGTFIPRPFPGLQFRLLMSQFLR